MVSICLSRFILRRFLKTLINCFFNFHAFKHINRFLKWYFHNQNPTHTLSYSINLSYWSKGFINIHFNIIITWFSPVKAAKYPVVSIIRAVYILTLNLVASSFHGAFRSLALKTYWYEKSTKLNTKYCDLNVLWLYFPHRHTIYQYDEASPCNVIQWNCIFLLETSVQVLQ